MKGSWKIPPALGVHAFSQTLYALLSFRYFVQMRPFYWWPVLVLSTGALYATLARRFRKPSPDIALLSLTGLVIANSVFLGFESDRLLPYLAAAATGVSCIFLFRGRSGKHPFNPSMIGGLAIAALFPASMANGEWNQNLVLYSCLLGLGVVTAALSRRSFVTIGYFSGFIVAGFLAWAGWLRTSPTELAHLNPALIALLLTSPSTLLFSFHVMTDPRTSPENPRAQLLFGACVGSLDLALRFANVVMPDYIAYLSVQAAAFFLPEARLVHGLYGTPKESPQV